MTYDIGITFGAYNLDQVHIDRFTEAVELSNPVSTYRIYPVIDAEEALHTEPSGNQVFSRSKALNSGIKELAKDCEVILCTDADILICPHALDLTFGLAKQTQGNIFIMVRNIDLKEYLANKNDWHKHLQIPLRTMGKGAWNAMTADMWFKSGGWNEELYGWGAEDDERHDRLEALKIPFRTIMYCPVLHINHPERSQLRRPFENMAIANSKDWTKYNWLK